MSGRPEPTSFPRTGSGRTRSRRGRQRRRAAVGLFLIARPGAIRPVPHGAEILLPRLASGLLPRQSVAFEQSPDRRMRVPGAPLGLDDLPDTWNGPKVGREPVGECTLREDRGKGRRSLTWDPRGAAGAGNRSKRPRTPRDRPSPSIGIQRRDGPRVGEQPRLGIPRSGAESARTADVPRGWRRHDGVDPSEPCEWADPIPAINLFED